MNSADLGQHAQSIFQAAIKRVRPNSLMRQSGVRALILDAVRDANRVVIVGFGKAAAAMACGLESIDELTIDCGSVVVPAAYLRNLPAEHQPRSIELLRSEEHTSELQSRGHLVCRLLLEKKKEKK